MRLREDFFFRWEFDRCEGSGMTFNGRVPGTSAVLRLAHFLARTLQRRGHSRARSGVAEDEEVEQKEGSEGAAKGGAAAADSDSSDEAAGAGAAAISPSTVTVSVPNGI